MKTILQWMSALCMFSFSTMGYAGNLQAGFTVGYDEAWIENNYGNWLTSNPLFGLPSAFSLASGSALNSMLLGMAQGNAQVIRVFLFPAVQGIQINTTVTSLTSPTPMTIGPTADLTASNGSLGSLASLLQWVQSYNSANNTNIKLYLTALNGADMNVVNASNNPILHLYYQRLISNNYEIFAYETKVLAPILELLSQYQDVVYGFDLINEIEGAINAGYFSNNWTGARAWIASMAYDVTTAFPWLPVTSTAGYGREVQEVTLGYFTGLHLSFYDVHIYSDTGTYSGQTALCARVKVDGLPIVLGEFGQNSSTVSDSIQNTATTNFLEGAKNSCFSGALAWKYESTSAEPWYSYLYVNLPVPSTGGALSAPPCPAQQAGLPASEQAPGPACARPAYATIQAFDPGPRLSKLVSTANPQAGDGGAPGAPAQNPTSLTDAQVADVAHVASQVDITTAKLALEKSSNLSVRAFASATLNDYTAADASALSSFARWNINPQDNPISQSVSGTESEHAQHLSQLSGAAFDEAYAQNELAYHVFITGAMEITLIPATQNPQVKSLLQGELSLYEKHLQEARALVSQLQTSTYLTLPPPKQ